MVPPPKNEAVISKTQIYIIFVMNNQNHTKFTFCYNKKFYHSIFVGMVVVLFNVAACLNFYFTRLASGPQLFGGGLYHVSIYSDQGG